MKQYIKKIIIYLMVIVCFLMSCPFYVYASEHGGGGGTNHNPAFITDAGTINVKDDGVVMYYIEYILANIGAIFVDHDITKAMANDQTMKEYIAKGKYDANEKTVTFPKETIIYVKQCIDNYAKTEQTKEENGGFILLPTTKFDEVPADYFINAQQFATFRRIVIENGVLPVMTKYKGLPMRYIDPFSDPDHPMLLVGDLSDLNRLDYAPHMPVNCGFFCANDWRSHSYRVQAFPQSDQIYTSISEGIDYEYYNVNDEYQGSADINFNVEKHGSFSSDIFILYSTTGERVRVFVSDYAAKNYSAGNRKIYFSENYYNYVPEDLTVSIDDLQKSVDDLQKIIDELLKKISDQTSEKEIEELLRQILEELRKNPGGGGGGSSGGDVTVSVDLKETNSWLSKIYDKVGQIFDKMQEGFEDVVEQLKKIKNWSAVDTVIDGVDAVADWLDLIHDVLTDGAGSAVAALSSALQDSTDLMKQKFPFSIPWDILFFVSVLSAEPETPQFSIPFNFEFPALDLSVDYEMELDFTPLQWLSDLSRLLLSMTYAAGLMKKTVDIVSANKEG